MRTQSCPTLWIRGLQPARLLCPWDSSSKNLGVGCHLLLHEIFPTQGSNPCLLHCTCWATGEAHLPKRNESIWPHRNLYSDVCSGLIRNCPQSKKNVHRLWMDKQTATQLHNKIPLRNVCVSHSVRSDSVTPWTVAHQAPLSMGFSRQEHWSRLPFPSPTTQK